MHTLLITGFGPFPAAPDNPTARLVEILQARDEHAGQGTVRYAVLPTEWERAGSALNGLFVAHRPTLVLHLGYAAGAAGFQLETLAFNEIRGRPDARGAWAADGRIKGGAPATLRCPLPIAALAERLRRAGLPAEPSADPGRYLCNYVYFQTLQQGRAALFAHLPALIIDGETVPAEPDGPHRLTLEEVINGIDLIAAYLQTAHNETALS